MSEKFDSKPEPREKKQFWAVDGLRVVKATGFSCGPKNPDYWWCPQVGFSGAVGVHLFENRKDAVAKAVKEAKAELDYATERLSSLLKEK